MAPTRAPLLADSLSRELERPGVTGVLAGTLSALSPGELFGHLVQGLRTGRLEVETAEVRRTISLRDGQVVFATSDAPHERLGAVLARLSLVSPSELESALAEVRPGMRLGQVLVAREVLTPAKLYGAMALAVREIVLGLFEEVEGRFLFLEGLDAGSDALKLPERTRELVLQGLARGSDLVRLRARLPGTLRLSLGTAAPQARDEALVERLAREPVAGAREAFDGGEHAYLSWLESLLTAGVLLREPPPASASVRSMDAASTSASAALQITPPAAPEPQTAEARHAEFVRAVAQAVLGAGRTLEPLRGFLSTPQDGLEEAFEGVILDDDGGLDVARVVGNVRSADPALARALALEALDAFSSYVLFTAKDLVDEEAGAALDARFRQLHAEEG